MSTCTLHLGTSGWSYKDWVSVFYPEGTAARDYLAHYTRSFGVVEIDSTFYGIPRPSTVSGWAERSPTGFIFCPKVPGLITHGAQGERPRVDRVLRDDEGELEEFLETMQPLGAKLGPILFQFPYFRVKELSLAEFLPRLEATLDRVPPGVRCAVEVRNKGWLVDDLLSALEARGAALAFIEHPYLPRAREQSIPERSTADFAYLRFLGDRYAIEKVTETWDRVVLDKSRAIAGWADALARLAKHGRVREIFAFANNHFAGHAPATCAQFRAAWDDAVEREKDPF